LPCRRFGAGTAPQRSDRQLVEQRHGLCACPAEDISVFSPWLSAGPAEVEHSPVDTAGSDPGVLLQENKWHDYLFGKLLIAFFYFRKIQLFKNLF
jgi:hypothetical protein